MPEKRPKLVVQMIVRNEEKRYLREVLTSISEYADKIVVIDDASTDKTPELCASFPKVILKRRYGKPLFPVDESKLRTELWEIVRKLKPDWVLTQDADEIFEKSFEKRLPELLNSKWEWISFHWCDMWDKNHYRIDKLWSPCFRRLFRFRDEPFDIAPLKIHCSSIPRYILESKIGMCYSDIRVKHLARLKDKKKKADWYLKHGTDPTDREHMISTFDPNPTLKEFKEPIELPNVLIAGLIRNRAWCLADFLQGLEMQDYPKKKISFHWVVGDCSDSTIPDLKSWTEKNKNRYRGILIEEVNFGRKDQNEHKWNPELLYRMGFMRNRYIRAIKDNEYIFSIDSDVILKDERILKHLVCLDREVVAEVCWATWGKINDFPLPTVWQFGSYGGTTEEFLAQLRQPGTYKVGGVCTCELIAKSAIEKGANFSRIINLPPEMDGEDRQFSVRCAVNGIYMWADTHFHAQHLEKETFELRKKMLEWKGKRQNQNRISLCMLTYNNGDLLDEFLYKMAPLFDEIVIVDTGSVDSSVEIAKKYTDRIFYFDWCDDFSAARNFLLEKATCPWIFYADADENYAVDKLQHFDRMVRRENVAGYIFLVFNYRGNRPQPAISESVRLFRNLREIKFTGLVHETLDESMSKYLKNHPKATLSLSPIPMYHWGFVRGAKDRKEKLAYYRKLNQKQLKANPKDCRPYYNLAMHLLEEDGNKEEGLKLLHKSIKLNPTFYQPRRELGIHHLREAREQFFQNLQILPKTHPFYNFQGQAVQWITNFLGEGREPMQMRIKVPSPEENLQGENIAK